MKKILLACAFVTIAPSANAETGAGPDCDYVEIRNLKVYQHVIPGCSVGAPKSDARAEPAMPTIQPVPEPILVAEPEPELPTQPEPDPQPEPETQPQPEAPVDDGDNGHGNDPGGTDPSNPGQGGGNDNGDNGHGNDPGGTDPSNPGKGGGPGGGGKKDK